MNAVHNIENACRTENRPANYHRFYALLNKLGGDREDMKETLVSSYTDGRTVHLSEMTGEYNSMCASLEERTGWKDEVKKKRSLCLKLMQKAGVDTTDWQRINEFCRNPKIAGKEFSRLGVKELEALSVKLRAIARKGGLRPKAVAEQEPTTTFYVTPIQGMGEA